MPIDGCAVIFDFDQTLVSTRALEAARESGNRAALEENIHKARIYPRARPLLEKLHNLNIPTAIVTNSPRWYVTRVCEHIGIDTQKFQAVICYNDVGPDRIKPSPFGIELALSKLGIQASNRVLYIGDSDKDTHAAYAAGVTPATPSWATKDIENTTPAAIVSSSDVVEFTNQPESLKLAAEHYADGNMAPAQFYFLPHTISGKLVCSTNEIEAISLGRYFPQSSIISTEYHDSHQLSLDISKKDTHKDSPTPDYWQPLISEAIRRIHKHEILGGLDMICPIPSRDLSRPNRLADAVTKATFTGVVSPPQICLSVLKFLDGCPAMKSLSAPNRALEIGQYLTHGNQSVDGKRILLIDDVLTTGATLMRAREVLVSRGAKSVIALTLARSVNFPRDEKLCPRCHRKMKIRHNRGDGSIFWGCSGFHPDRECTYTENIGKT